jgi:hypothetical protein
VRLLPKKQKKKKKTIEKEERNSIALKARRKQPPPAQVRGKQNSTALEAGRQLASTSSHQRGPKKPP